MEGKSKERWVVEALAEYEKRLQHKMQIEWILVNTSCSLKEKALKEPFLIALDIQGKLLSSEELSRSLFHKWGSRIAFVIGGPNGLCKEILSFAKEKVSLSLMTFTHQMVRVILAEQLYRATTIEEGSSYHK